MQVLSQELTTEPAGLTEAAEEEDEEIHQSTPPMECPVPEMKEEFSAVQQVPMEQPGLQRAHVDVP